jgi:gliding motility-associated-like protein
MRYLILLLLLIPTYCSLQTKISIRSNVTNTVQRVISTINPNSSNPYWMIGATTWTWNGLPGTQRMFFKLDIPELPMCSEIIDARLSLWAALEINPSLGIPGQPTYGSNNAAKIFRVAEPWDSNTVSWFNSPSLDPIDFIVLSQSVTPAQDYLNLDVTKMVQKMVTSGNHGMLFKMDNEITPFNSMMFYHEKAFPENKRPLLEITYVSNGAGSKATISTDKTEYCIGEKINFTFNSTAQISSYSWFLNNKYISNNKSDQTTATTIGNNKLTLYYFNGCISDSANFIIKVIDKKQATILDSLCPGQTLKYYDLTIDSPGIYSTVVRSTNSCDTSFTIIVSLKKDCKKCFVEVNTIDSICEGETYFFQGNTLLSPGVYSKSIKNFIGCDTTYTLELKLKSNCEKCNIQFPNIFSPNNDNINDYFIPFIDCTLDNSDIKSYNVKVYNRWGQKVAHFDEKSKGWDGKFKNGDPILDTYIYIAEVLYQNNQSKVFKGDVTLVK